jgi:hypothetical protein
MNAYEVVNFLIESTVTSSIFRDALLFTGREEEGLRLFESTSLKLLGLQGNKENCLTSGLAILNCSPLLSG